MIRRKLMSVLMLLSMAAVAATGCAGTDAAATEQTEAKTEETKQEITVTDSEYIKEIRENGKLVVGCKSDVPGFGYYDEEAKEWSGLEVELAYKTAALIFEVSPQDAKEKDLVEIKPVTVADREEILEAGEIDCMLATYTITEEREERFALSDSYYTDYIGIMVRDSGSGKDANSLGSNDVRSLADLGGKYIGVPRNATTRDAFLRYIESLDSTKVNPIFCEFESYEQLFKALKNGNIDAMSVDVSILNGYKDSSTKILSDRFAGQHYGAAVQKKHADLLQYINQAIAQ